MADGVTRAASRRRFFVTTASTAASLAGGASLARRVRAAANDRVNVCVIGVRGRGRDLLKAFAAQPDVTISHVCDVNEGVLGGAIAAVREARAAGQAGESVAVGDLRKVLDDRSVDAIVVATPDHWHALATIWGCQAGKHVYVEKPVSNEIFAGRQMVLAARRHGRLVQVGTQSRSAPHYLEAMELLRSGRIGRVHMAKAWNSQLRRRVPAKPDEAVPRGLDWDLWQGPAPERPYNENRYTYGWRWLWDYGTGDMGNDGVHDLDIARWGLGVDHPLRIDCTGGRYWFEDRQETPDTATASYDFGHVGCEWVQSSCMPRAAEKPPAEIVFYGDDGTMAVNRDSWKVFDQKGLEKFEGKSSVEGSDLPHVANFLEAIRGRATLNSPIAEGQKSAMLCHLGNIAYRTNTVVRCDPKTGAVIDNPQAKPLWGRESYRTGWDVRV